MNGISQWGGYGGQQLAPQGLLGSLLGGPVGGLIGRGIGGLFGNAGLGSQIGQMAGGIGGSILPFSADPMQAFAQQLAQQQQLQQLQQLQQMQQLAPQGMFGNLIGQLGQPLGSAIGGLFGQSGLGSQIGGVAGQLGRMLPFQTDPMQQAWAQQQMAQLAPQGLFGNLIGQLGQPVGGAIGSLFGQSGLGNQIGGIAGQLGRMLPFQMDPMQQAWAQQQMAQLAPQGLFGNLIGQLGQPLGGAIGSLFGQPGIGNQIGGIAGQLGRMLPFQMDAMQQAWAQQQQQQQPYAGQGQQNYASGQTLH